MVQKFGAPGPLKYVEVWIEWIGGFGMGRYKACLAMPNQPWRDKSLYTKLLCQVYGAVKAVNPRVRVIGGSLYSGATPGTVKALLDAGAGKCMDELAVRIYPQTASPNCPERRSGAPVKAVDCVMAKVGAIDAAVRSENGGKSIPIAIT